MDGRWVNTMMFGTELPWRSLRFEAAICGEADPVKTAILK
jgi:hypothetical protein